MANLRASLAPIALFSVVLISPGHAPAAIPVYKLGDIADQEVITPVALTVVDPVATEKLKEKLSQEVLPVVRFTPAVASDVETRLRQSLETAKANFLTTLRHALNGQPPADLATTSPAYLAAIRIVSAESPAHLPFAQLAPLWLQNKSDHLLIADLLQPLKEVMIQPIVASKTDSTIPSNQSVQLITVSQLDTVPTQPELERPVTRLTSGKILSLWRARRLVETSFPPGQEDMGRFVASFVKENAAADPALTDLLRAQKKEGVSANNTYEAAQVIIRKGQIIDQAALSALAAMRERSLIGTLQSRLDQEQSLATQIKSQTKWIVGSLIFFCMILMLVLWRLRARPSVPALAGTPQEMLPGAEERLLSDGNNAEVWRSRALLAEGKAERAHQAIRSGVLGWMREKIFQTLFRQRTELLSVQKKAELEMGELEQRLESLHTPLQERIRAYEQRIEELERELAAQGKANRDLIGARIAVARQHLDVERERSRFPAR
ncbi:MAG: hypothetical protein KAX37_02895 [Opitutaceae bacterium]|nr:hypothetical protein [Opitutaceae bacterium]